MMMVGKTATTGVTSPATFTKPDNNRSKKIHNEIAFFHYDKQIVIDNMKI
jgi:hypothetical protein